jgi:glucose/arabinose dehydrogenase
MNAPTRVLQIFSVVLLAFAAVPAWAVQLQFTPSKDNTLYEDAEGDVSNGSGEALFMGRVAGDGSFELRRAVVAFDVSGIPWFATIDSVEVNFTINQVPNPPGPGGIAYLHRLTSDWGEGGSNAFGGEGQGITAQTGDASWQHRFYDTELWDSPGGDFLEPESASEPYGNGLQALTFGSTPELVRDVQDWVRNPHRNFGWILLGDEGGAGGTARRISSRENNEDLPIPQLTVNYSVNLELTPIASGLSTTRGPVGVTNAGDGSGRVFIVEQQGIIHIFDTATQMVLPVEFLNISTLVDDSSNEQGLLGLAFHPDYSNNRQFYVYYTYDPDPDPGPDRSRVAMYRANAVNPDIADALETPILEFAQDSSNHNGGDLHFGRDGYLYIASGDGGGQDDEFDNAQDVDSLKGKLLRIDVDSKPGGNELCGLVQNYAIPSGNAFPGGNNGCDEILHYGLRNPWRFSFDALTEEMYIGDVGQFEWEEIDYAPVGASGINFGWSCREGFENYVPPGNACISAWTDPLFVYGHVSGNCSVTGGFVYRGSAARLAGHYFYGDWCSDKIWIATRDGDNWSSAEWEEASSVLNSLSSFGQDERCELYVTDRNAGIVYRIDDPEGISSSGFENLYCR